MIVVEFLSIVAPFPECVSDVSFKNRPFCNSISSPGNSSYRARIEFPTSGRTKAIFRVSAANAQLFALCVVSFFRSSRPVVPTPNGVKVYD